MKKKRQTQKTKKSKHNSINKLKLLSLFLLVFLFAFLASGTSYFLMNKKEDTNKNTLFEKEEVKNIQETKIVEKVKEIKPEKKIIEYKEVNNFEEKTEEFKKDFIPNKEKIKASESKDIFNKKSQYIYDKTTKPKLAIVIDDVSNTNQKRNILSVGEKITMAFLPPTSSHKNSAKIAQDLPFYMIHFPMQASPKFKSKEKNTLTINHTYEQIEQRVKQIRQWYPNAKYTNNHTGSVFTADEQSMDYLFQALIKYDFLFVDSRTTAKSQVEKMAKKYNKPYIVRNTFLDNKREFYYIQNQLKKAIKIAKQRGYAIAIGHPYKVTIEVIKNSKHLLKDVELIYVNELPYL